MGKESQFRIVATPDYQTVTPGATVDYWCARTFDAWEGTDGPRDKFQWYCINDPAAARRHKAPYVCRGPALSRWPAHWDFSGRHVLQCHVAFRDGGTHVYEHVQTVEEVDAVLARELERARREEAPSPDATRSTIRRYVQLLKDIEKAYPIEDGKKKEEHEKLVAGYEAYTRRLDELLQPTDRALRQPIRAAHVATESQERTQLSAFVARIDERIPFPGGRAALHGEGARRWVLVDWTNPLDRARTSTHEGIYSSVPEALKGLMEQWSSGNRYPPGKLRYEIPATVTGDAVSGGFDTSGKTTWDRIGGAFEVVGYVAAGVAFVACLVAPVPGSSLISAAIWTSIFSSTAAAVINIGQRHTEGFADWRDDAFDTLTIVGNLFAAGGMWAKGATVLARNAEGQVIRSILIGQVMTDGVQGVLIAAEHVKQYDAIMADRSLTPDERARKLLELFRSLAVAGVLTYISIKGTARDLANLNARPRSPGAPPPAGHIEEAPGGQRKPPGTEAGPVPAEVPQEAKTPREKLQDLADPKKVVDLTKQPKVEGTAEAKSTGKLTTKVQVSPERLPVKPKPKSPFDKFEGGYKDWLNFRVEDDYVLLEHEREGRPPSDSWIFEAKYDKGDVKLTVVLAQRDAAGNVIERSERLRAGECYEAMFEHFESRGRPIQSWSGQFAWDNYRAVKAAIARGATPEQAVLESITARFWKKWAAKKRFRMKVVMAAERSGNMFDFKVVFEPE